MRRWNVAEYDVLFRQHPPNEPHAPDLAACRVIAGTIRRTSDAVSAQWHDARSAVLGSATAASSPLIDCLRGQRWLLPSGS
jgi:hypothetical protein